VRHEVSTITFARQYPAFLFPGTSQEETGSGAAFTPAPRLIDSIDPLNWVAVGEHIRHDAPDLLLLQYWMPFFGPCWGTIAREARRNGRTRVAYLCHNILPHEHRPFDRLFSRYAFRAADGFLVHSRSVERDLDTLAPGAVRRIASLPLHSVFGEPIPREEARRSLGVRARHILLFFGYIRRYKGLDILLDAVARLPRTLDCHLLVAGEFYENEAAYRDRIATLGIGDRVTIRANYLPSDQVARYFSAANAVVLPYRSATQSGIIQTAYHFGTPVIATPVGGLAEVVVDNGTGIVVPPEDPEALAAAIVRFFDEGNEQRFRDGIVEERQKYSWETLARTIEALASDIGAGN
jgi:glycosyltransferase involved in cell wall biosynthesis